MFNAILSLVVVEEPQALRTFASMAEREAEEPLGLASGMVAPRLEKLWKEMQTSAEKELADERARSTALSEELEAFKGLPSGDLLGPLSPFSLLWLSSEATESRHFIR